MKGIESKIRAQKITSRTIKDYKERKGDTLSVC